MKINKMTHKKPSEEMEALASRILREELDVSELLFGDVREQLIRMDKLLDERKILAACVVFLSKEGEHD